MRNIAPLLGIFLLVNCKPATKPVDETESLYSSSDVELPLLKLSQPYELTEGKPHIYLIKTSIGLKSINADIDSKQFYPGRLTLSGIKDPARITLKMIRDEDKEKTWQDFSVGSHTIYFPGDSVRIAVTAETGSTDAGVLKVEASSNEFMCFQDNDCPPARDEFIFSGCRENVQIESFQFDGETAVKHCQYDEQ